MLQLTGEAADGYVAVLRKLLAVARPGAQFPDARGLDAQLSFLGPAGSRGVRGVVDVDPASGLPSVRELLRVRADRELADAFLKEHAAALPEKAIYYRALAAVGIPAASSLDVRLRGRDRAGARFEVVHDRLDAASGCVVRFTMQLTASGKHVGLARGDLSEPTARFKAVVEKYAGADAELALLLLAEQDGVRVREVVRGQIGPLHFAGLSSPPVPSLVAAVLAAAPGAFVLHLALERAGTDVSEENNRDPFAIGYRDSLGPDARAGVERRRADLGYKVARERRLYCTPSAEIVLAAALARAGAKLVVRSA